MIRLFAALAIPREIGEPLSARQTGIEAANWRPLDALHITLRFFGDITEPLADDLDQALESVRGEPLTLSLEGVGYFGEGADIHAVWAGVTENERLRVLAGRCEAAAKRVGLTPDKRGYRPHVTLAYMRRPDVGEVAAWVQSHALLKSPTFEVARFGLYSSVRTREGSRYDLERSYRLGG